MEGRLVHPSLEKETQEALQQRQGRESDGGKMAAGERGDMGITVAWESEEESNKLRKEGWKEGPQSAGPL